MTELPLLSGRDLLLSFGPTRALAGATMEVRPGEIVALPGPSGLGKLDLARVRAQDAGQAVPQGGIWWGRMSCSPGSASLRTSCRGRPRSPCVRSVALGGTTRFWFLTT